MLSHVWLFCNPMDCSPPGSTVHGVLLARILEWVAVPFSRGSSQPRDWVHISCVCWIGRQIPYHWATREAPDHYTLLYKWDYPIYNIWAFTTLLNTERSIFMKIETCASNPAGRDGAGSHTKAFALESSWSSLLRHAASWIRRKQIHGNQDTWVPVFISLKLSYLMLWNHLISCSVFSVLKWGH